MSAVEFEDKMENLDLRHKPLDESFILDLVNHSAQILRKYSVLSSMMHLNRLKHFLFNIFLNVFEKYCATDVMYLILIVKSYLIFYLTKCNIHRSRLRK